MSYRLTSFAGVALPIYDAEDDAGSDDSLPFLAPVAGGGQVDLYGTGRVPGVPLRIVKRCALVNGSLNQLQSDYDALRALRGQRGQLVATLADESTTRWRNARLVRIDATRRRKGKYWMDLELVFQLLDTVWKGDSHSVNTTLATNPTNVSAPNNGNADVTESTITITAGSSAITSVTVSVNGAVWTYSGTIAAGKSLVIDAGNYSVQNDGSDDYANFSLGSGHSVPGWILLKPGGNSISVSFSGGSTDSTFKIDYYDGWQ